MRFKKTRDIWVERRPSFNWLWIGDLMCQCFSFFFSISCSLYSSTVGAERKYVYNVAIDFLLCGYKMYDFFFLLHFIVNHKAHSNTSEWTEKSMEWALNEWQCKRNSNKRTMPIYLCVCVCVCKACTQTFFLLKTTVTIKKSILPLRMEYQNDVNKKCLK